MIKSAVVFAMMVVFAFTGVAEAQGIRVNVNGVPVVTNQPPIMLNGHVLVPVRGIFEALGAGVIFEPRQQTITATSGSDVIVLRLGSNMATVNGQPRQLEVPARTIGGSTMVPLRFISEALGADVRWNDSAQTVTITSGLASNPPPINNQPPPINPPPPQFGGPIINSVVIENPGSLQPGQTLNVTLYGQPGGRATFDIGSQNGLPMGESPSGVYRGSYTVRIEDSNPNATVTGHLNVNGRTDSQSAPRTVALLGQGQGQVERNPQGLLGTRVHLIDNPLVNNTGSVLDVTFQAPSGGTAFFTLGGQRIPMTEGPYGTYRGIFNQQAGQQVTSTRLTTFLQLASNWDESRVTIPTVTGNGFPPNGFNGNLALTLQPAGGNLSTGQVLRATLTGPRGGFASFDVGGRTNIPMTEVGNGTYIGNYTVQPGDSLNQSPIFGRIQLANGVVQNVSSTQTISLNQFGGNPNPFGPNNGSRVVVIEQPTMRSFQGARFQISGRAVVGSNVRLQVFTTDSDQPGGRLIQGVIDTQKPVGPDGRFIFPIRLDGAAQGDRLSIVVHDLDVNGNEIGSDQVFVTLQ